MRRKESGGFLELKIAEDNPNFLALDYWSYRRETRGRITIVVPSEPIEEGI